jgi:hypothetical protein
VTELDYAIDHLRDAVRTTATAEGSPQQRLQAAWTQSVQMVWMKPCLTAELLAEFRDLWQRYTAPADDPHSTVLRPLDAAECAAAVDDVLALLVDASVAAQGGGEPRLATMADLA